MLNMDDLYFVSRKKNSQFKLKAHIGPYIVNARAMGKEAYEILKKMNFKFTFTWSYYPLGIISKLRVEQKTTAYAHTPRLEIE